MSSTSSPTRSPPATKQQPQKLSSKVAVHPKPLGTQSTSPSSDHHRPVASSPTISEIGTCSSASTAPSLQSLPKSIEEERLRIDKPQKSMQDKANEGAAIVPVSPHVQEPSLEIHNDADKARKALVETFSSDLDGRAIIDPYAEEITEIVSNLDTYMKALEYLDKFAPDLHYPQIYYRPDSGKVVIVWTCPGFLHQGSEDSLRRMLGDVIRARFPASGLRIFSSDNLASKPTLTGSASDKDMPSQEPNENQSGESKSDDDESVEIHNPSSQDNEGSSKSPDFEIMYKLQDDSYNRYVVGEIGVSQGYKTLRETIITQLRDMNGGKTGILLKLEEDSVEHDKNEIFNGPVDPMSSTEELWPYISTPGPGKPVLLADIPMVGPIKEGFIECVQWNPREDELEVIGGRKELYPELKAHGFDIKWSHLVPLKGNEPDENVSIPPSKWVELCNEIESSRVQWAIDRFKKNYGGKEFRRRKRKCTLTNQEGGSSRKRARGA